MIEFCVALGVESLCCCCCCCCWLKRWTCGFWDCGCCCGYACCTGIAPVCCWSIIKRWVFDIIILLVVESICCCCCCWVSIVGCMCEYMWLFSSWLLETSAISGESKLFEWQLWLSLAPPQPVPFFFNFERLFWNQILTCVCDNVSSAASFARSGKLRYWAALNSWLSLLSCSLE